MSTLSRTQTRLWLKLFLVLVLAVLASILEVPASSAAVCQCECAAESLQCKLACGPPSCWARCNSIYQQCLAGCPPWPGSC